ncbi:MAG: glucose-1-phosphate thymidylyltransferase [Tepidiformaceae bacterium]
MKGIVLAGGKGSRLRPFTYSGAKQLVPIANTPVLHFPVRQLVEAGITEIALVVGDTEPQIREAMGDGSAFGACFQYVSQSAPLGIAHGVSICRDFIGSEPFVLYLGDNVLQGGIVGFVEAFLASGGDGSVILKAVDDPRAFGVAELNGERLVRVHEKPKDPPSNLAVIGIYAFTPAVFGVIDRQAPSGRGELEIADAISGLLAEGRTVTALVTPEYWIDTGKMEDMLAANRVVLAEIKPCIDPSAQLVGTVCEGRVSIAEGAELRDCRIAGPVAIGARAKLSGCTVGPDVAIGADCVLRDVSISDSIVMEQSELLACESIVASMIGRFAYVSGAPAGARLTLGDHSRVEAGE